MEDDPRCPEAKKDSANRAVAIFKSAMKTSVEGSAAPGESYAAGCMLIALAAMFTKKTKAEVLIRFSGQLDKAWEAIEALYADAPPEVKHALNIGVDNED